MVLFLHVFVLNELMRFQPFRRYAVLADAPSQGFPTLRTSYIEPISNFYRSYIAPYPSHIALFLWQMQSFPNDHAVHHDPLVNSAESRILNSLQGFVFCRFDNSI
jgi:hypothetical protein